MAKISIIIPVFKVEKYLARCLDSLTAQTFTDFEAILIDDCSPDKSGFICDEYAAKDGRFKVVHREKNGGASAARNIGLEMSEGEYISFVDSDDYVVPTYLETLISQIEKTGTDVTQCGYFEVINEEYSKEEQTFFLETYTNKQAYGFLYGDGSNDVLNFLLWNKLFRKKPISDLRFVEGLRCEDAIFISEVMATVDTVSVSNERIYYYCRHEDSVMGQMQKNVSDMILSHLYAYRKVAQAVNNSTPYIQELTNARLATYYVSAIKNKMLKGNKQLKAMLKEDKKQYVFLKNKRIPFIKRVVLAIGG